MPTAYLALDIARRTIQAAQTNLQVISHNIANSGRPGYSRQRAEMDPSPPLSYPSFQKGAFAQQLGTGVKVYAIVRIRDEFLDHIIRTQTSSQGGFTAIGEVYKNLEVLFNEPSSRGLGSSITEFFQAWNDLTNDPELTSTRANLREKAIMLTGFFHDFDTRIKQIREDTDTQVDLRIDEVNNLLRQVADLNIQVMQVEGLGDHANDLKDMRDLLVEQLSEIMAVNTIDEVDGSMSVMLGALRIVERDHFMPLEKVVLPNNTTGIRILGDIEPDITGGTLFGLMESRDVIIPEFQRRLDILASGIVNRVNMIHIEGWGLDGVRGRSFFDDLRTSFLQGTVVLPPGTTEDTTLFDLGITEGYFELNGVRIVISVDDVSSDDTITLGELFDRIDAAQHTVRASLSTDSIGNITMMLDVFNPAQQNDGIDFFVGSTNFMTTMGIDNATLQFTPVNAQYGNAAARIDLAELIEADLDVIAAALDPGDDIFPGIGNNDNAIRMSQLQDNTVAIEEATIEDFFSGMIASLGVQTQANNKLVANQDILLSQLKNQREEISGVSLDEEATKIIEYQRLYEGAARVISVIDGLLDTLINRMGV